MQAPAKFTENRPFANPDAAARELLRIYKVRLAGGDPYIYTGVTNSEFIWTRGGSVEEYGAGRDYGIAQGWFRIDTSGIRIFVLPAGDEQT